MTLNRMKLTNDEVARVAETIGFLEWLKQETGCLPEKGEEEHLLCRYLLYVRAQRCASR